MDLTRIGRSLFITAFFSSNQKEDYAKHQTGTRASFLHAVETHLTSSVPDCSGPFIIGNIITVRTTPPFIPLST